MYIITVVFGHGHYNIDWFKIHFSFYLSWMDNYGLSLNRRKSELLIDILKCVIPARTAIWYRYLKKKNHNTMQYNNVFFMLKCMVPNIL